MMKKVHWLLLPLLLTSCTTTMTNLTSSQQPRNAANLYPVEVEWSTRRGTIRPNSLQGFVLVGTEAYPLQQTPLISNRWETLIPVPANQDLVHYRFRFDYRYDSLPHTKSNSIASPPQTLKIRGSSATTNAPATNAPPK